MKAPYPNAYAMSDFAAKYEATVMASQRRFRRVRRPTIEEVQSWYKNDQDRTSAYAYSDRAEDVDMIEIWMPTDKLPELVASQESTIYLRARYEREMMEKYPSVKEAWDQYQLILSLVRE